MEKLELIQEYIDRCERAFNSDDRNDSEKLQKEIIAVFSLEISNIKENLDSQSLSIISEDDYYIDYISDVDLLRQKLVNYAANIKGEQDKIDKELELARLRQPSISAQAHAESAPTLTANITISIDQTINQVNEIAESTLSPNEKETLRNHLYAFEGIKHAKDKTALWSKAKEILKFVLDKGIDVAIAVIPLIASGLQGI